MTYTTDQAVQMAREVGLCLGDYGLDEIDYPELAALCNKVERDTLLKAAEWFKGYQGEDDFVEAHLRRMAGEK